MLYRSKERVTGGHRHITVDKIATTAQQAYDKTYPPDLCTDRDGWKNSSHLVLMNSFDTLIFPDTDIFKEKYYPLLLFCSPLHFLQPVEADPTMEVDAEAVHFYTHGLWQPYTPAPLGNRRQQFLQLIADIKKRKKYYLDRLSALTTDAGAAAASTARPGQKNDLVASLLTQHGVPEQEIEAKPELWQSRLILSIAEILEAEENDLEEEISYLTAEEIATLRALKKDDSGEEYPDKEVEKLRPGNMIKRFDAWLYLMQQEPLPTAQLWLASSRAAAEQILQRYKSASGNHAVPLLKLVLPAAISASGRYVVEQIEAFHQATSLIHRGLAADFTRIATAVPYLADSPESLLPYGTDWADQWETMLYDSFPAAQDGRTDITFYLLPDQPVAGLFAPPAAGKKEGEGSNESTAHGLLGVLGSV